MNLVKCNTVVWCKMADKWKKWESDAMILLGPAFGAAVPNNVKNVGDERTQHQYEDQCLGIINATYLYH